MAPAASAAAKKKPPPKKRTDHASNKKVVGAAAHQQQPPGAFSYVWIEMMRTNNSVPMVELVDKLKNARSSWLARKSRDTSEDDTSDAVRQLDLDHDADSYVAWLVNEGRAFVAVDEQERTCLYNTIA